MPTNLRATPKKKSENDDTEQEAQCDSPFSYRYQESVLENTSRDNPSSSNAKCIIKCRPQGCNAAELRLFARVMALLLVFGQDLQPPQGFVSTSLPRQLRNWSSWRLHRSCESDLESLCATFIFRRKDRVCDVSIRYISNLKQSYHLIFPTKSIVLLLLLMYWF